MDEASSHRVKLLRFPLILLVLFIHSYIAPVTMGHTVIALPPAPWLLTLQTALSNGFARTAVPLFFLMSGYLYFFGFDGTLAAYRSKTARRIGTLLVPFVFWNVLVIALFALGQTLPQTAGYFNAGNGRIADAGAFVLADMVFGLTHYPLAYQFWFIRDLMVIALLAPLAYWAIRWTGPLLPLAMLVVWLFSLPFLPVPAAEAVTFFVIGAWLAQEGRALFPPARWAWWLAPVYAVLLAADVAARMLGRADPFYGPAILVGVVFVLAMTGFVRVGGSLSRVLMALSSASFFVFAAHEPLMTMLRKLVYRALPPSQATILTAYALLPLVLAFGLAGVYFVAMRVAPRFVGIISGGR